MGKVLEIALFLGQDFCKNGAHLLSLTAFPSPKRLKSQVPVQKLGRLGKTSMRCMGIEPCHCACL